MEALAHEAVRKIVTEIVVGEVEAAEGEQEAYNVRYTSANF